MAILATIFGMLGRFAGRILTTTLGWAGMLLFGQVRKDRQVVLAAITFGSVVWVVLLVGVIVPDVGTMLLAFVPVPDFVDPAVGAHRDAGRGDRAAARRRYRDPVHARTGRPADRHGRRSARRCAAIR